jgi:hypothetical protein
MLCCISMLFDCYVPLVNIGRTIIHNEFGGEMLFGQNQASIRKQNYAALQGKKSFSGKKSLSFRSKCIYFLHQYKAVIGYRDYTGDIQMLL